jgi:hypothetical protein
VCPTICGKRLLLPKPLLLLGKELHPWREMNGFAGLKMPRRTKLENAALKGRGGSLQKGRSVLVAGQDVFIAEKITRKPLPELYMYVVYRNIWCRILV